MSVLVNKLDTTSEEEFGDSSEFDIETLDDIKQTGGAASGNNNPNLSVPLNNNSSGGNMLNKPANMNNTLAPNNALNKLPSMNNQGNNRPGSMSSNSNNMGGPGMNNNQQSPNNTGNNAGNNTGNNTGNNAGSTGNNNTGSAGNNNAGPGAGFGNNTSANNTPKTKKNNKKKGGLTKKKQPAPDENNNQPAASSGPSNNDIQPKVEIGNDRGTMTIKYASSKTMVPLFSTDKSDQHIDLGTLRDLFKSNYEKVSSMNNEELTNLRHEMHNTDFNELGADSMITGLLYLLDDCDTKKLTLRMMLAKGELKIGA